MTNNTGNITLPGTNTTNGSANTTTNTTNKTSNTSNSSSTDVNNETIINAADATVTANTSHNNMSNYTNGTTNNVDEDPFKGGGQFTESNLINANPDTVLETNNNTNPFKKRPINLTINFKSTQDEISNVFLLDSDFATSQYGLSPSFFDVCVITIEGKALNGVRFSNSPNGCLRVTIVPDEVYDKRSWKTIKVYFPESAMAMQSLYKFNIIIDGNSVITESVLS